MGPRDSGSTAREGLRRGHRFGFVASTDQHSGYPGSYGEGRLAVLATATTRAAIWEALLARRTYAVTGDKIEVEFGVNGVPFGGEATGSRREVSFRASGGDFWDCAEVVKNGRVWRRWAPVPSRGDPPRGRRLRAKVRIEWGWSRPERETEWRLRLRTDGAVIRGVETCFRGDPVLRHDQIEGVEERVPHEVLDRSAVELTWRSKTKGNVTTRHPTTQALIATLEGAPDALLRLNGNGVDAAHRLSELLDGSRGHMSAGFASPAVLIHRAIPERAYVLRRVAVDERPESPNDHYYLRLAQRNGQYAWVSPVWVSA